MPNIRRVVRLAYDNPLKAQNDKIPKTPRPNQKYLSKSTIKINTLEIERYNSHPLGSDFILEVRRLEQLGIMLPHFFLRLPRPLGPLAVFHCTLASSTTLFLKVFVLRSKMVTGLSM